MALALTCVSALQACAQAADGGTARAGADAGPEPVRALYKLADEPMRFLSVPWPDDAYLDASGHVRVRAIPTQSRDAFVGDLAESMAALDGFGLRPTIYFRFDGALDPASLPARPEASVTPGASVFLIDVDTSSPTAFERIPVEADYHAETHELRMRPAFSRALAPGRRYAAIVTRKVTDADGRAIDGAKSFLAIRDAQVVLAAPAARAAAIRYAPVLEALEKKGVSASSVAAMAVFRVQSAKDDLADAREIIRQTPAGKPELSRVSVDGVLGPPSADVVGLDQGAPHSHIGFMLQGTFPSVDFITAQQGAHGAFTRSSVGKLRARRTVDITFTIWLPLGAVAGSQLPLVIVQHGLGGDRSDALALADAFAAVGTAVIAFDAPFHGLRGEAGDGTSRFTGKSSPDGFGDAPGDFAGVNDNAGGLTPLHPFYYRDAVRQGAVDLMALVYLLQEGDLSTLSAIDPALEGTTFDVAHLGFVGVDVGAAIGLIASAAEPGLSAMVLAGVGGLTIDGWVDSPASQPLVEALMKRLGRKLDQVDFEGDNPLLWPDLDAWRTLADQGAALAYASAVRRLPSNILMLTPLDDEVVHNRSAEALGYALGAVFVGGKPRYVPGFNTDELRPGATLSGNYTVDSGAVTRVLYVIDPATHEVLVNAKGTRGYEVPLAAPLSPLPSPIEIDNPISQTLTQVVYFFESLRACYAAVPEKVKTPAANCAAAVRAIEY